MIVSYPLEIVWPHIVGRIKSIGDRFAEVLDWTDPEEIRQACRDKRAFIFHNDEDDSFAIVKIITRNDEKILFIWIAWSKNGKDNMRFLREIAHNVGASRMEMESPRQGFERMPEWRPVMTKYRAEV